MRAKTVDLTEEEESGSCPIEGCPTTNKILQNIPKLGSDDTVIIMIHGNAKVHHFISVHFIYNLTS